MTDARPTDSAAQRPTPIVPLSLPGHAPRVELPRLLTSFVGREREIAAIATMLRREGVRFLILIGPGGVGKSRLALRVAEELLGDYPDGVWFVPLAPVRDPALVAATIAGALGVRETAGRPLVASLQAFLRDKQALLILDNFEHVLDATPLVTELLTTSPRLAVLVTSRAVLRLSGEHDFVVPPLALPDLDRLPPLDRLNQVPTIRLFVDRARAVRADFVLTDGNAPAVAQICHRLDGLPLAIELAASRSSLLPPALLLDRLEPRLPLLAGGPRDAPARLQTMRDAIAWSHDLLSPEEQALFRRLAVFTGGFTLDAAERVASRESRDASSDEGITHDSRLSSHHSVLDGIASLLDKSLIWRLPPPTGEVDAALPRFGMLETIREYGLEQLAASGEGAAVRDTHTAHLLGLVESAEPHLFGPDQAAWLDRLEVELPNLRAALGWLHERGRAGEGLRLAAAPGRFWWRRGYLAEGRSWLERFLALPSAEAAGPARVKGLIVAGSLAAWQKDLEQSISWNTEALALATKIGDNRGSAQALLGLGNDAIDQDDPARAEPLLAESLTRFRELGDVIGIGRARDFQGMAAVAQGDYERAAVCFSEALALFRGHQDWRNVAGALDGLAQAALGTGDVEEARGGIAEALDLSAQLGDKTGIAWCLMESAGVAAATGQAAVGARLLGASGALREVLGARFGPHEQRLHDRIAAAVEAALGKAAFAAAWELGAALPLADAVAEAEAVAEGRWPEADEADGASASLTPRELEVLRLVAAGKSDQEIAATLSIARPTASNHVSAILAKLGLRSRAAAAAYAVRHRLV